MSVLPIYAKTQAPGRNAHRRRFRKYLILILLPVTIAVLVSGAISVYSSFQEIESELARSQHEKALAAAAWIEQYIRQIEGKLTYAARPLRDASDFESRRIEFLRLLRQERDVRGIVLLDPTGHEQITISRLGMDVVASGKDRSQEPASLNAKPGKPWFGPVYFRDVSQPYMTIAIRSSDSGLVIIADVNLGFVFEFVSRIKIGDPGKVYVVDGSSGFLIADPDIGNPLRNLDMSDLHHVKAAVGKQNLNPPAIISRNLAGAQVLTSFAQIELLHWYVFVEQPMSGAYKRLHASVVRTGLLLLAGFVISAFGARALADRTGAGEPQKID